MTDYNNAPPDTFALRHRRGDGDTRCKQFTQADADGDVGEHFRSSRCLTEIKNWRHMDQVEGTFDCPLCGFNHQHEHTGEEVAIYNGARTKEAEFKALEHAISSLSEWARHYGTNELDGYDSTIRDIVILRSMQKRITTES
jgi:hypothetical protein